MVAASVDSCASRGKSLGWLTAILGEQLLEELHELGLQVLDDGAPDRILGTATRTAPPLQPRQLGKEGIHVGFLAEEEIPQATGDREISLHPRAFNLQPCGLWPDSATVVFQR